MTMTRFFTLLLSGVLLSACTLEGFPVANPPHGASLAQAGTCFAVVSKAEDGSYTLATGVGDGTPQPSAVHTRGLSAKQVDTAAAKEREIMKINPECLATYVFDRAAADPASVAPPAASQSGA